MCTLLNSLLQVLTHRRYIPLQAASNLSTHHGSISFAPLDRDLFNWDHQMHQLAIKCGQLMQQPKLDKKQGGRCIGCIPLQDQRQAGGQFVFSAIRVSANCPLPNEDGQEGSNQWVDTYSFVRKCRFTIICHNH